MLPGSLLEEEVAWEQGQYWHVKISQSYRQNSVDHHTA